MNLQYHYDTSGNLTKVTENITQPDALILLTTAELLESHVAELEKAFPGVPSIGGIAMSYGGTHTIEQGVTVISLYGTDCAADVMEQLSTMPVKYISRLKKAIEKTNAVSGTSACFDICSGNDGKLVTTLNMVLGAQKIPLVGGNRRWGKSCRQRKDLRRCLRLFDSPQQNR